MTSGVETEVSVIVIEFLIAVKIRTPSERTVHRFRCETNEVVISCCEHGFLIQN